MDDHIRARQTVRRSLPASIQRSGLKDYEGMVVEESIYFLGWYLSASFGRLTMNDQHAISGFSSVVSVVMGAG